ncbi:hypothetical protein IL306_008905 [Fusarium sp. DS 682]|nr:hypothetical protein IL306_008905 [Fusarium sp. DS 682]
MSGHTNGTSADVGDMAVMVDGLNLDGKKKKKQKPSLKEGLRSFDEAAAALSEHGASIINLLKTSEVFSNEDLEAIFLARTRSLQLRKVAQSLKNSAFQAIVKHVISLGDKEFFGVDKLLQHFEKPINNIAENVARGSKSKEVLRKVAEECYHQAASPSGKLDPDEYPGFSKWPDKEEKREDWIKFWLQSLCRCPDGPTLFQPQEDFVIKDTAKRLPKHMPQYLFRALTKQIVIGMTFLRWSTKKLRKCYTAI